MHKVPDNMYPAWVYARRRPVRYRETPNIYTTPPQRLAIQPHRQIIEDYFKRHHVRHERTRNGDYYFFGENLGVPTNQEMEVLDNNKIYIEDDELLDAQALVATWEELSRAHLHPYSMKLADSYHLVMYWDHLEDAEIDRIRKILVVHSVKFRGPCQDTPEFYSDDQGRIRLFIISNDSGLAGGRYSWSMSRETYEHKLFFEKWLQTTFAAGKQPHDPWRLAFLRARLPDANPNAEASRTFVRRVASINPTRHPVLYFEESIYPDVLTHPPQWHHESP